MLNLVQNKRMHVMNIFPFVWVRYIMHYHGKHGGRLVTLWIQWNVTLAELVGLAHVSNQGDFTVTSTVFFTIFNNHHCIQGEVQQSERYPKDKMALRDDKLESSKQKQKHFSPSRTLFKKPIVIQLVQVQLRAFQLQIRAELRIRIDNQARSLPKTQASC